jgi:hypothetical protein
MRRAPTAVALATASATRRAAAFTSTDGRAASTNFGVGSGCGRAGHPTTAHVHQSVRLGDQAWGSGNWDPSGAWDDRYPTTLVNSRTVSIEHHDNGGQTRGNGKGIVPEAIIVASIADLNRGRRHHFTGPAGV